MQEELTLALTAVLETAVFSFPEPTSDVPDAQDEVCRAEVGFRGAPSGRLILAAPATLCRALAADMLALEPDEVGDEQAFDVLGELANMTCGQWLTTRFGTQVVFRLTPPARGLADASVWQSMAARPETVALRVGDDTLLAELVLSGPSSASSLLLAGAVS